MGGRADRFVGGGNVRDSIDRIAGGNTGWATNAALSGLAGLGLPGGGCPITMPGYYSVQDPVAHTCAVMYWEATWNGHSQTYINERGLLHFSDTKEIMFKVHGHNRGGGTVDEVKLDNVRVFVGRKEYSLKDLSQGDGFLYEWGQGEGTSYAFKIYHWVFDHQAVQGPSWRKFLGANEGQARATIAGHCTFSDRNPRQWDVTEDSRINRSK